MNHCILYVSNATIFSNFKNLQKTIDPGIEIWDYIAECLALALFHVLVWGWN